MRRWLAFPVILAAALSLQAEGAKAYGKPLTLKEEVPVADLLANPEAFAGKKVRVRGVVTDVCQERGCWIRIGADKKQILFKVEDGVISFPMSAKGGSVVAEGILSRRVISVEDQKAQAAKEAAKHGTKADLAAITAPKVVVRLEGLGAEIQ